MQQRDSVLNSVLKNYATQLQLQKQHEYVTQETQNLWQNHKANFIKSYTINLLSNTHTGNTLVRDMPIELSKNAWWQKKLFEYTRIWNMLMVAILIIVFFVIFIQIVRNPKLFVTHFWAYSIWLYCIYIFTTSGISFYQGDRFNAIWMPLLPIVIVAIRKRDKI